MQSKIIKYATGFLVLSIVSVWLYFQYDHSRNLSFPQEKTERDIDDPNGRRSLEWMKLRDPKTGKIPADHKQKEQRFSATLPVSEQGDGINLFGIQPWREIGPWNVGGRTRTVAFDVSNSFVILAAGVNGGIWRSEDRGKTWTKTTGALQSHDVVSIVQDTRIGKENEWYATTGEFQSTFVNVSSSLNTGGQVYKSIDGGENWAAIPITEHNNSENIAALTSLTYNMIINTSNTLDTELFIATVGGIVKIYNNGLNMERVLPKTQNANTSKLPLFSDIAISSSGTIYAFVSSLDLSYDETGYKRGGVYRSKDGGNTWTNISEGDSEFPTKTKRMILATAPSDENILYALGETIGQGNPFNNEHVSFLKYEFLTEEIGGSGGKWYNRSENLSELQIFHKNEKGFYTQGGYNIALKVMPNNPDIVFFGGTDLHRTTDGLETKNNVVRIGGYHNDGFEYPNHHADQHTLAFDPRNFSVLISGHDGGISITNNCLASNLTWDFLNNGYLTTQFYNISISSKENNFFVIGGLQDNGTHIVPASNESNIWDRVLTGDGGFTHIRNDGLLIASSQFGEVFLLNENQSQFKKLTPEGASKFLFINPFALDPLDEKVLYLPEGDVIWRNSNIDEIPSGNEPKTKNWKVLENTRTAMQSVNPSASISAIEVSSVKQHRVFYGTTAGNIFLLDNAHLETSQPINITGSDFPQDGYISSIALDQDNENIVIVVFSNYGVNSVFYTENGGSTWINISGNLEANIFGSGNGPSCHWAEIFKAPNGKKMYFLGTTTGLYTTTNIQDPQPTRTPIWVRDLNIGNIPIASITSRSSDGFVAVATHGGGVFTNILEDIDLQQVASADKRISSELKTPQLLQNYPNPFISKTTIPFILGKGQNVKLMLYDASGREVKELLNERKSQGQHSVTFENGSLSSGIYFYTLQTETEKITKKMLIIR